MIRALEQKTCSDLMSAPKLTVLSRKIANLVAAEELHHAQSYGETHSEVGSESSFNNTTSAGVTITAELREILQPSCGRRNACNSHC